MNPNIDVKTANEIFDTELKTYPPELQQFFLSKDKEFVLLTNISKFYINYENAVIINTVYINQNMGYKLSYSYGSQRKKLVKFFNDKIQGLLLCLLDNNEKIMSICVDDEFYGTTINWNQDKVFQSLHIYLGGKIILKNEFDTYLQSQKKILLEGNFLLKDLVNITFQYL